MEQCNILLPPSRFTTQMKRLLLDEYPGIFAKESTTFPVKLLCIYELLERYMCISWEGSPDYRSPSILKGNRPFITRSPQTHKPY